MSNIIENLIVGMKFDNKQFEAGAKLAMATLSQLKGSMNFGGASKSIDEASAAVGRFSFNPMTAGVDAVSAKFMALSTIAITALSRITNKVIDTGTSMVKALTIDPITSGLQEYELNMNSIQTILANTQASGAGLEEVNNALDTLNNYADDTKYSFAEMAKNIGTFTAAGVDLDTSAAAIKGIANLAAISGSNSQQASGAMYQLSQAISAGRVSLEDWNSVVNAGMGGTVFQRALAQTAEKMGTLSSGAVKLEGDMQNVSIQGKSFRESITAKPGQESWLTSEVLTETLKQFTGDLTDAELAAQGFNEEQIRAIQLQAETAKMAATEAKTFNDVYDSLKEGVGSGWATTWRTVIGDFEEAKTLWTGVYNTMDEMLGKSADARNEMLAEWKKLGGRDALLDGLKNAFDALMSVVTPIKEAFRQIFPPTTAASLVSMTQAFARFTEKLKAGSETADKIKRTFAGVFAIFGIGWEVVKGLFTGFAQLFGAVQGGGGGFLSLTATIGDWIVKVHQAIKDGGIFTKIFEVLGNVIGIPIRLLGGLGEVVANVFAALGNLGSAAGQIFGILATGDFKGGIFDEDSKIVSVLFTIREAFESVGSAVSQFWNILAKGDFVSGVFSEDSPIINGLFTFRDMIKDFFSPGNLTKVLGIGAGGGIAVALGLLVKNGIKLGFKDDDEGLLGTLKGMFSNISGAFESVTGVIDSLTGALTTMQNNLKATILLKIAAAVGLLALSIKLLSTIDAGDLAKSLTTIGIAFAQLLTTMTIMSKIAGAGGLAMMPALAVAMMAVAGALLIFSAAVKVMATMSWDELFRGLFGVAVMLGLLVAAAYGLDQIEGKILRAGLAMIPLAIGVRILASAVKDIADLEWGELLRGLFGLAGMLTALTVAMRLMPKNMPAIGAGLVLVGAGLSIITRALKEVGSLDIEVLRQGIIGVAIALGSIAIALKLMPKNMVSTGAGLILVATALQLVTGAVLTMGGMGWEELIRGLVGLGGAMAILTVSLSLMSGTISGSIALGIAAAALALLIPQLLIMSAMSWQDLLMGLGGLAGIFTVIGLAGLLLMPIMPAILGLGAAMVMIGLGMTAVGAGALLFSMALTAAVNVLALGKQAVLNLVAILPQMASAFAEAIASFLVSLAENAGEISAAFKDLMVSLLDAVIELIPKIAEVVTTLLQTVLQIIIDNAPKIGEAFTTILTTLIQIVTDNAPRIWEAGFNLITGFLQTISQRVPEIVTIATDIIVNFINAIGSNIGRVVEAGFNLIITFLNSLANTIRENAPLVTDAALNVADAIIDGLVQGILNGLSRVANAAREIASNALNAAKNFLGINSPSKEFIKIGEFSAEGLVIGIASGQTAVNAASKKLAGGMVDSFSNELSDISAVAQETWGILSKGDFTGIGPWQEDDPIVDTLFDIREGLLGVGGAAEETWGILSKGDFTGVGPWQEDSPIVDGLFHIREEFEKFQGVGEDAIEGLINGFKNGTNDISRAAHEIAMGALDSTKEALGIRSPSKEYEKVGDDVVAGLVTGIENGLDDVEGAGQNMATKLFSGFSKGLGETGPDVVDQILKVLKTGEGDLKMWGANAPLTMQLIGLNQALKQTDLQLAIFFGAVNAADPAALEEYVERAGNSLTYLAGLLDGLANSANKAFGMLKEGETLDNVLGDEDFLKGIINSLLSLVPGVEGAAIRLGITLVDGIFGAIFGEGLIAKIGGFIKKAVRTVAGWFGIEFPEEEAEKGEQAVEDFVAKVEGGHGRFEKLTKEGVAALTTSVAMASTLVEDIDTQPTITPVLELTQFNKDRATMLNGMDSASVSVDTSSNKALDIFEKQRALFEERMAEAKADKSSVILEFNQTNNSPKALNHVDIYRQTKGQLSLAKEALKVL